MHDEVAHKTRSSGLLARVEAAIGPHLRETETIFFRELESREPFVRNVLGHLTHYRGKRLRPILLLLSAEAAGGVAPAHPVLAAVVEMIHTATLVHDDVLDEATTRRHVATINAKWNNETSVLLGDFLFTHAFHLTSSLGDATACRIIGRATNIVCEGEMSQIAHRADLELKEERYLEIIEAKTAELCAVSCALGARFAGASDAVIEALDGFGRALGIAFQIVDDLLDVTGSERVVGKSLGSDLRQQKLTLPLIHLLAAVDPGEAERLREMLRDPECDPAAFEGWLERTGALQSARSRAEHFIVAARQRLAILPESPARQLLEDMADYVTQRNA